MSNKKDSRKGFVPMFPGMLPAMQGKPVMPPLPFANGSGEDARDSFKKFWEQMIDMQKSAMDSYKEQWNQFFEYMMDMEDTFAESLPDEVPSLPGFPVGQWPAISPKEFMKQVKEFQEMANKHFIEQADSAADFSVKGKEKLCDIVNKALDSVKEEKKDAPAQTEGGDKPAEQ